MNTPTKSKKPAKLELPWRKMRREINAEIRNGNWLYLGADPDPTTQILLAVRRATLTLDSPKKARKP